MADNLERDTPSEPSKRAEHYKKLEEQYWQMVDAQTGGETLVEYAADVATTQFGSGFGRKGQKILHPDQKEYESHPWNLNNLPGSFNSLMQFDRNEEISGINAPWLYVGMRWSTFCWHYEDLMLFSMNYAHWGSAKQWYCIPEEDREKFVAACKQKLPLLFSKDSNILHDMVTMISPTYLIENGVSALFCYDLCRFASTRHCRSQVSSC